MLSFHTGVNIAPPGTAKKVREFSVELRDGCPSGELDSFSQERADNEPGKHTSS